MESEIVKLQLVERERHTVETHNFVNRNEAVVQTNDFVAARYELRNHQICGVTGHIEYDRFTRYTVVKVGQLIDNPSLEGGRDNQLRRATSWAFDSGSIVRISLGNQTWFFQNTEQLYS